MNLTRIKAIQARIVRITGSKSFRHLLFWSILLLIFILLDKSGQSRITTIFTEFINILFYALVVYFNLYYLIPNYLSRKRFLTYCGLLILTAIIITPIKIFVLYVIFYNFPLQQKELIDQQNFYFVSTFFFGGASTIYKIIKDWARHQRERQELQTRTMQTELQFLKSQINPHFLFNTLNSLYALTLQKSDRAPEIVIKLSEMMRYMLYECNEKKVLLSKEVNYLRNYLDLEKLRQANVDIHFEVNGSITDHQIAPLLLIPFVENSFKHGLNPQLSKGYINIKLNVDDHHIHFFIENNKPEKLVIPGNKRSGGIGLVNVKRRLNLLYPHKYELQIDDNPKTYAVHLNLDLNPN